MGSILPYDPVRISLGTVSCATSADRCIAGERDVMYTCDDDDGYPGSYATDSLMTARSHFYMCDGDGKGTGLCNPYRSVPQNVLAQREGLRVAVLSLSS